MADTTKISRREWLNYIERLSKINDKAADDVKRYVNANGGTANIDRDELINYAYGVVTKYGEASASLSAEMYDAVANLEGRNVKPAVPADTPTYSEVAKTMNGILKQSLNEEMLGGGAGRLVKRTGVDTVMNNALRDGAQWAWIPSGDTCAFCIALASRGWQKASKKALKNGHAEHIHANCDCTYAIRFDDNLEVEGYDPKEYQKMYYGAEGNTPEEKINSMRRMFYAENKDIVGVESDKAEELIPQVFKLEKIAFRAAENIAEAENYAKDTFVNGGFNLTGKDVSYKGIDVDVANSINNRLDEIYNAFDIPKLSSLESYGKANKRAWTNNEEAPMFTTNFGNVGLNNTIIKSKKTIDNYNKQGAEAFRYVLDNMDSLTGDSRKIAEAYKLAGKSLVGNSVEDFITHEIGHHISYIPDVNKKLVQIQKETNWKDVAARLSGYSNHSFGEYFAESFNAYCRGEQDLLQPELIEIFEGLRKKA